METAQKSFRILSIDGGGVRGIIPARILQAFEEITAKPISKIFDLIVGTSTGGLIALGLTYGDSAKQPKFSAKEIVNIYLNHSPQIFSRSLLHTLITGAGLWGAKYSRDPLDKMLNSLFSTGLLSQAICPVIVPTYSLIKGLPNLFMSHKSDPNTADYFIRDVAGATNSAPTYFPPKEFTDSLGNIHIEADGGIFANNPEVIGVTEAYSLDPKLNRQDIELISIGTGSPKLAESSHNLINAGVIGWVMKANLIDLMIDANSAWTTEEISTLYSTKAKRLQIPLPARLAALDNASSENLHSLLEAAESYIHTNFQMLSDLINPYKR